MPDAPKKEGTMPGERIEWICFSARELDGCSGPADKRILMTDAHADCGYWRLLPEAPDARRP